MKIEDIFKSALYNSNICGIFLYDEAGKIISVNDYSRVLLGYKQEDKLPDNIGDIIYEEDAEVMEILASQQLHKLINYEHRFYRKDGSVGWCMVSCDAIDIEGRQIIEGIFVDITEQKEKQNRIEQERELFMQMYNTVPFGIAQFKECAGEWKLLNINKTGAQMLMFQSSEEFKRQGLNGYVRKGMKKEDRQLIKDHAQELSSGGDGFDTEIAVRMTDGSRRVHACKVQCISSYNNENTYQVVFLDISEQKEAERALAQEHEYNEMIAKFSDAYLLEYKFDEQAGTSVRYLKNADDTTTLFRKDIGDLRTYIESRFHPDDVDKVYCAMEKGEGTQLQARAWFPQYEDTQYRWHKIEIMFFTEGSKVKRMAASIVDVEQSYQMQHENRELNFLLDFVVKRRYEMMGIIIPETGEYRTYMRKEDVWNNIQDKGDYDDVVKKYAEKLSGNRGYKRLLLKSIEENLDSAGIYQQKVHAMDGDERRWKLMEFVYLNSEKKQIVMVESDIDKEEKAKEELKWAVEEARAANESKSVFLANMSHEIRTPMNAIIGLTEIVLRNDMPKEMRDDLIAIQNSGNGLLTIVNDVLDFSKIESGKFVINNDEYRLDAMLASVSNMIAIQLLTSKVVFWMEADPDLPVSVMGDGLRIKQILLNLLSNAVKCTEKGQIVLTAKKVSDDGENINVAFEVRDTGVGISEDNMKMLFEKFFQVNDRENRQKKGTGLGLAISQRLAELMGGKITVESEVGKGSAFTLTLPQKLTTGQTLLKNRENDISAMTYGMHGRKETAVLNNLKNAGVKHLSKPGGGETPDYVIVPEENYDEYKQLPELAAVTPIVIRHYAGRSDAAAKNLIQMSLHLFSLQLMSLLNGDEIKGSYKSDSIDLSRIRDHSGKKVLVVDDNMTNLYVARGLLKPYRLTADIVSGGKEAIEKVKQETYDIILMDQMMPDMDGACAMDEIRALKGKDAPPVVVLTANVGQDVRENLIERGFDDYLAKPINMNELDEIIEKYLPFDGAAEEEPIVLKEQEDDDLSWTVTVGNLEIREIIEQFYLDRDSYTKILHIFEKELVEKSRELEYLLEMKDIERFTIIVHGLKSSAREVGAKNLSETAYQLEKMGKNGDEEGIIKLFPEFVRLTEETMNSVKEFMGKSVTVDKEYREKLDPAIVSEMKKLAEDMDYDGVMQLLRELEKYKYDAEYQGILKKMIQTCENFEYEKLDDLFVQI